MSNRHFSGDLSHSPLSYRLVVCSAGSQNVFTEQHCRSKLATVLLYSGGQEAGGCGPKGCTAFNQDATSDTPLSRLSCSCVLPSPLRIHSGPTCHARAWNYKASRNNRIHRYVDGGRNNAGMAQRRAYETQHSSYF